MKCPVLVPVMLSGGIACAADSTIHPTNPYGYSANGGWIHFRPSSADGVRVGDYHLSGYAYGANFGWISFGDDTPENGHHYSNTSAADCGVNQDGAGNLSGYAYSATSGWVSFGWAASTDPNRPRFDPFTGVFSGYAYSANMGWINLAASSLTVWSVAVADSDGDGISDEWEYAYWGKLTVAGASSDFDGDGSPDSGEYAADTDPLDPASRLNLRILSAVPDGDTMHSTLEWPTRPSRLYRIWKSPDLTTGSWTLDVTARGDGTIMTDTRKGVGPKQFYRISAETPMR